MTIYPDGDIDITEYKSGKKFGKSSAFWSYEPIENKVYHANGREGRKDVTSEDEAFFKYEGETFAVHRAVDQNWKQYANIY